MKAHRSLVLARNSNSETGMYFFTSEELRFSFLSNGLTKVSLRKVTVDRDELISCLIPVVKIGAITYTREEGKGSRGHVVG